MKRKGLLVCMFMALATFAFSQAGLRGDVRSGAEALAGATVTFDRQTVAADSLGNFQFSGFSKGKHLLAVSMAGYEPHRQYVLLRDSLTTVRVDLVSTASSLDAVVVSGTMKAVKRLESPIAVEVYSQQFFKKNPSPSVFESLSMV
ncbi:MAG TPA: carboxypeptidase-like regulatory domain-containing protein, partial [Flavisolibacter sp.]|nr:carboxypeptidase-like regulatory domain-containing protein [Flavisolibacter sp.]